MTRGTIAERAQLNIDSIPAVCYCPNCKREFQPSNLIYECPECHHFCTEIRAIARLKTEGFSIYWHHQIPTNDGGIAARQIMAALRALQNQSGGE